MHVARCWVYVKGKILVERAEQGGGMSFTLIEQFGETNETRKEE